VRAIAAIDPNIFYYLESTQAYGQPNINHQLLMRMALKGATILTTNFDTRIEQAAGDEM
jgi:NAD-dependent SIR2 family protein deacetylase